MLRYLFNDNIDYKNAVRYDTVIIGGGIAGLYAALNLSPKLNCALIAKNGFDSGSSWLAQGGTASVLGEDDSFEEHISDTLIAGAGHCRLDAVKALVQEGPSDIQTLIEMGVPFDREPDGELHLTREGGHSHNRIVHCGGDASGKETTKRLSEIVLTKENITIFFRHYLVDILTESNEVRGVVVHNGKSNQIILTRHVIIATGGIGQLYRYTTNPVGTTGEGIAACVRAGAKVQDMEFVQFHPTALVPSENDEKMFLISEAVRGEGGILKNNNGEAFMVGLHSLADLAPRDIVTRAILKEMRKTKSDRVFLDVTGMSDEFFSNRFPTITAECRKYGVDVPRDFIPVCPTQHYLMGGVQTDLDGKTCIDGLYVCGEAACTGVQGANRLASNSTLECLVFGRRAAIHISNHFKRGSISEYIKIQGAKGTKPCPTDETIAKIVQRLKCLMTEKVGAIRNTNELSAAVSEIESLISEFNNCIFTTQYQYDIINRLNTSYLIASAALARKDSMGSHYITAK
jgi:L-aspartate oxidase